MVSILNSIVKTADLRPHIQDEININYKVNLNTFLNSQKIFLSTLFPYHFRDINMTIAHSIYNITIDQKMKGIVAQISFGIQNEKQTKCGILPKSYNEKDYGGIVEYITLETV